MKPCLYIASMVLLAGAAVAQDTTAPAQQPAQNPPPAQTNPPSSSKSAQTNPPSTSSTPAQVKTQTYKGTLVDAACTSQGATPARSTASASSNAATPSNTSTETNGAANRSASDQGCPVSATSTQFGLRMTDGHVVRFDMVGNDRAQQAIKDKKKWNDAATAGKTIHAKVAGMMSGDTLTVVTID